MTKSKRRGNRPGRAQNGAHRNQYQALVQEEAPENSQVGARSTLDRIFGRTVSASENATNDRNNRYSPNSPNGHPYNADRSSPLVDSETNPMSTDLLIDIGPEPVVQAISNYLNQDPYNSDVDTTSRHTSVAEEDVCFPQPDIEKHQGETDYEALQEFLEEESDILVSSPSERQNRKSGRNMFTSSPTSGGGGQSAFDSNRPRYRRLSTVGGDRKFSMYGDRDKVLMGEFDISCPAHCTHLLTATIHARTLSEIPSNGENLIDMMKQGQYWIDILNPTDMEMKALSKIFHIHPLTTEDISMEESREKCEVFKNYIFVCFRSFDTDQYSVNYLQPIGLYIIMTRTAILTNVRKRIKQLKDYINVTPDWILYALLDDITDTFAPLIRAIEFEVDSIDELVLILKESEQSDMLRRIGYCRKRMMGLLRLLVSKADVVKTIVKRNEGRKADGLGPALSPEVVLYLGDVQGKLCKFWSLII
ncbi:hypothetical protein NQZ79_g3160 [Umbelopsis isabellina]|nr:hypothetical protein NQZ79_g3160 [Umbelopsis isabellina]